MKRDAGTAEVGWEARHMSQSRVDACRRRDSVCEVDGAGRLDAHMEEGSEVKRRRQLDRYSRFKNKAREDSAAAEQMATSCHIARSNCAWREVRKGAGRVNWVRTTRTCHRRRHGDTSCYAAIPILDADMQV